MHTKKAILTLIVIATVLAACGTGTASTSNSAQEASPSTTSVVDSAKEPVNDHASSLQKAIDSNYDGWTRVDTNSPVNVIVDTDVDLPLAFAIYDRHEPEIIAVKPTERCDQECSERIHDFLVSMQSESMERIEVVAQWSCGMCPWRPLVAIDQVAQDLVFLSRDDVLERLGPIDTEFEAMLVAGPPAWVKANADGFEAITQKEIEDCDPVIERTTLSSIDAEGVEKTLAEVDKVYEGVCS